MGGLFNNLAISAVSEIFAREPTYFDFFPLAVPDVASRIERISALPVFEPYARSELTAAIASGFRILEGHVARRTPDESQPNPIDEYLIDCFADAYVAEQGQIRLCPKTQETAMISDILEEFYDCRDARSGNRYWVRKEGSIPVVVINALGIPIGIWSKFLSDPSHDYRIILCETRCGSVFAGGMERDVGLEVHAADVIDVLHRENCNGVHVIAWCNGGRIAIELARNWDGGVKSLVLISTTMRGAEGVEPQANLFEDNLDKVFKTVTASPKMADSLAKMMVRIAGWPDWKSYGGDKDAGGRALIPLPAREHSSALVAPMKNGDYLLNYARRTKSDEAYPIHKVLPRLNIPILVIVGNRDNVVNNAFTCSVLDTWSNGATVASVSGAGHYVHDLQYPYFLMLVERFLRGEELFATARVAIGKVGNERL